MCKRWLFEPFSGLAVKGQTRLLAVADKRREGTPTGIPSLRVNQFTSGCTKAQEAVTAKMCNVP